jgi:hypothetical protein
MCHAAKLRDIRGIHAKMMQPTQGVRCSCL